VLAAASVLVMKVFGISHRLAAIQQHGFEPGSPLYLRPDLRNEFDKNAIGVWDASGKTQAGFVPKELAEALGKRLAREQLQASCLWGGVTSEARGVACGCSSLHTAFSSAAAPCAELSRAIRARQRHPLSKEAFALRRRSAARAQALKRKSRSERLAFEVMAVHTGTAKRRHS
jgi:hypothetical protein